MFSLSGVLTINIYNEQIFNVLYIWISFVLAITIYDFISWLIFLVVSKLRYSFFVQRIQTDQSPATLRAGLNAFVNDYLQLDGFFILRLIHSNVGDDTTSALLNSLWKNFQRADASAAPDHTIANLGATVSLTASGTQRTDIYGRSMFNYNKATTHV